MLISTQHRDGVDIDSQLKPEIIEHVLRPILPADLYDEAMLDDGDFVLREPDRALRARRPGRRHRPHRPQDHRGHVRRRGPSRRRRVLRQGSDEGRPLRGLRRALRGEERRRRRPRRALRAPDRLRDRRRASGLRRGRVLRDRGDRGRRAIEELVREHFDLRPGRDRPRSRPAPPDLREDRRLRALRPQRSRLHLGAHGQGRRHCGPASRRVSRRGSDAALFRPRARRGPTRPSRRARPRSRRA